MKCPKDCEPSGRKILCNTIDDIGYICTRPKNHKGLHHAHGIGRVCYSKWRSKK